MKSYWVGYIRVNFNVGIFIMKIQMFEDYGFIIRVRFVGSEI